MKYAVLVPVLQQHDLESSFPEVVAERDIVQQ
jgi:hypothetical protein